MFFLHYTRFLSIPLHRYLRMCWGCEKSKICAVLCCISAFIMMMMIIIIISNTAKFCWFLMAHKPNQTIMILCLFLVSGKQRNEHSFFFISKFFVLFIWRKFIEENVSVKVQKRREHFHVVVVVVAFENFYFALGFLLRTFYFYSRGGKREKVNSEILKWGYPRLLFN